VTSSRDRSMALGDRLAVSLATAKRLQSAKDSLLSPDARTFKAFSDGHMLLSIDSYGISTTPLSNNHDELQRWLVSLRENPRQYKSIFGFTKGHDGDLRASVGKRPPQYSTRSPFFLAAMGSTCKQGNPNGNQKWEGTTLTLGRRKSKKRRLLNAIDNEGCFPSS